MGVAQESNWEDQGNLEFEKGTGVESLDEADVPFVCGQDAELPVESQDAEPCVEAQKKSEEKEEEESP